MQALIERVDPELDQFVLIHTMGNDAQDLAIKTGCDGKTPKKNTEKFKEIIKKSSEFCKVVTDLLERIPYLKVAVSTILPRYALGLNHHHEFSF